MHNDLDGQELITTLPPTWCVTTLTYETYLISVSPLFPEIQLISMHFKALDRASNHHSVIHDNLKPNGFSCVAC